MRIAVIYRRRDRAAIARLGQAQYVKSAYLEHGLGVVKKDWDGLDVVRMPVTDAFGLALGCRASVVPMRQFSETRPAEPDEDISTFCLFDRLSFADLPDGGGRTAPASCTFRRGRAEPRKLPDVVVMDAPGDDPGLRDKVAYAYLQRSLEDEADVLLRLACGSDSREGSQATGAPQAPSRIDGGSGSLVKDPSRPPTASALTCKGPDAAKKEIVDHGFDGNRLVCYTTVDALRDLSSDPKFGEQSRAVHGLTGRRQNRRKKSGEEGGRALPKTSLPLSRRSSATRRRLRPALCSNRRRTRRRCLAKSLPFPRAACPSLHARFIELMIAAPGMHM